MSGITSKCLRSVQRNQAQVSRSVFQPTRTGNISSSSFVFAPPQPSQGMLLDLQEPITIQDIRQPVLTDMEILNESLLDVTGDRHSLLKAAMQQIFGAGGKRIRPMLVLLLARATCYPHPISDSHRKLAEITEMIHTASLVHDDVLDDCALRRGKETVNAIHGNRIAVLAGDFLFAQSSWYLAKLGNLEVIKLISKVIADFADGEISQATSLFDVDYSLDQYLDKSFYKTASLIAASCRSAAVFSGFDEQGKQAMFDYGKHLGLAFQVVDDILDFTQSTEQLGKPQGQDLASGNLTAPAIFALQQSDELRDLIENEFAEEGDLAHALELVQENGGIEAARSLARRQGDLAKAAIEGLPSSQYKQSLMYMVDYVLERLY
eukprot:TRINITY_DN4122_c0_g1_i1.p1 TRINITY_DN4122_c0_g1~~TRINITY_DN4122_c0_g1_i1.p1  ORF type:complete len:378 (-),score=43.12 TRINITY_DN4122_c0_g1_i1:904-2037(-)